MHACLSNPCNSFKMASESEKPKMVDSNKAESIIQTGEIVTADWTPQEEHKTVRKIDLLLLPLLILSFFLLQCDRGNISNALTDTILKDLGITSGEAAFGNQLQLAGIVIFEIPANLLVQKFGPQPWVIFQMFSWSLVATFQSFITNKASFYGTRFLLGMFEGGFIPGAMFMLSIFYTRLETSTRFTIFYFGNFIASGTSALIAAGILTMDGVRNWAGWRWLFMINGVMTFGFAIVVFAMLPGSPRQTRPIHRLFDLFTERDRHIMQTRLLLDSPNWNAKPHYTKKDWVRVFINRRLWMHCLINLLGITPAGGISTFGPTIIKLLGFSKMQSNALISVGYYIAVFLAFGVSLLSQKTKFFGFGAGCLLVMSWCCIFSGALYGILDHKTSPHKWTMYGIFIMIVAGNLIVQPINNAWTSSNAEDPKVRSIGLAMCVIGSNLGGLVGQQLFKASDSPHYRHGFTAVLAIYVATFVVVLVQIAQYWWDNKKMNRRELARRTQAQEEGIPFVPEMRYVL